MKPPQRAHAEHRPADTSRSEGGRQKARPAHPASSAFGQWSDHARLARAYESNAELDRRFEAAVFDWDGTAVADRDGRCERAAQASRRTARTGFDLALITGTADRQRRQPAWPSPSRAGRIIVACNSGSEVFELTAVGPVALERHVASNEEEELLDRAAELTVERLAERGLSASIISDRLNRRRIDLFPRPRRRENAGSRRSIRGGNRELRAVEITRNARSRPGLPIPA